MLISQDKNRKIAIGCTSEMNITTQFIFECFFEYSDIQFNNLFKKTTYKITFPFENLRDFFLYRYNFNIPVMLIIFLPTRTWVWLISMYCRRT